MAENNRDLLINNNPLKSSYHIMFCSSKHWTKKDLCETTPLWGLFIAWHEVLYQVTSRPTCVATSNKSPSVLSNTAKLPWMCIRHCVTLRWRFWNLDFSLLLKQAMMTWVCYTMISLIQKIRFIAQVGNVWITRRKKTAIPLMLVGLVLFCLLFVFFKPLQ